MDWRSMDDPDNRQNKNAGNGGDLVKHTVYLVTLEFLLQREPWSSGMRLRECHAGRGIYYIPRGHDSRPLLSRLHSNLAGENVLPLAKDQQAILRRLGCWPNTVQNIEQHVEWYAGSALLNARKLAGHSASHTLEFYEWEPETQQVLRCALTSLQLPPRAGWTVLSDENETKKFDGEAYINREAMRWSRRDLILLDPFAIWSSTSDPGDQRRRDIYGRIFDNLARHATDAPSLILFWTWGSRHQAEAKEDLDGTASSRVNNGYLGLRAKLHEAGLPFVRVKWCWRQWFAIWVVAPSLAGGTLTELADEVRAQCKLVTALWERRGHGHPQLEVGVDST